MGIKKQIGWGVNSNLLATISNQIDNLIRVVYAVGKKDSRPYKVFSAIITQNNGEEPSTLVLENTLGEVNIMSNQDIGLDGYLTATSADLFTVDKTVILVGPITSLASIAMTITSINRIDFSAFDQTNGLVTYNGFIEIRVYN